MLVGKGGEPGSRSRFGQSKTVIFIAALDNEILQGAIDFKIQVHIASFTVPGVRLCKRSIQRFFNAGRLHAITILI